MDAGDVVQAVANLDWQGPVSIESLEIGNLPFGQASGAPKQ
jgi:hypothetical protein